MRRWRGLVGDRPVVTRLVLAVAVTMAAVLLVAGAFVYWRVAFALDRQIDQDLSAYAEVVVDAVAAGRAPPTATPGLTYEVYDVQGGVLRGTATTRLIDAGTVGKAAQGGRPDVRVGRLLPAASQPYNAVASLVDTPDGAVVVASAISRNKHDEALRELVLQLGSADLATLAAASLVGYATARAALDPVERYRVAAERVDGARLLPVTPGRDDEITRLGHTFNALLARLEDAAERERRFLADAAHELRSPLALMRAEVEWALVRERGPAEDALAFESLRDQVDRLVVLAEAVLDLEELHASGRPPTDLVDVGSVVTAVTERLGPVARSGGRRLQTSAPSDLLVAGHARWLDLAVANLVTNALRHGEGTVRVVVSEDAAGVEVSVQDEGAGFAPGFEAQAFDRFSRADTSRSRPGTGLGLAIVRAVAEAHGGSTSVSGARVTLRLPPAPTSP